MKKSISVAMFCLFGLLQSNAQVSFSPGIKGGLNFAHFTQTTDPNQKYTNLTDFYVGFLGELNLSKVYSLQPEILYTRQGSGYERREANNTITAYDIKVSYLSLGLANKFKFNKFNLHVGPTVDININDKGKTLATTYNNDVNNDPYFYNFYDYKYTPIDLAVFIGAGYDITDNFGVEARIKKGLIDVTDWGSGGSNVVFQTGVYYKFKSSKKGTKK